MTIPIKGGRMDTFRRQNRMQTQLNSQMYGESVYNDNIRELGDEAGRCDGRPSKE